MAARSAALDAVRVLGVAAVVVGHAIPNDAFRQILFAWHVPVFFVLSGYLWRAQRPFADEVRARSSTLVWPYLFWLVVVGVLYVPLELSGWVGPAPSTSTWTGPLLGGANAHEPYTTFWFVSVLFFVALLYRLLSPLPVWMGWAVAVIGLVAADFVGPAMAHTPLAVASAVPCLVFLLVGRMSRALVTRLRATSASGSVLVGLALVVLGELLVVTEVVQPVDIKAGRWGTPVLAVLVACAISVGLVLVAEAIFARASERLAAATTSLAYAGLCVVLVHPVVQWLLRPFDPPVAVFVVAMLVLPWLLGLALRRTPIAQIATGSPRSGRAPATTTASPRAAEGAGEGAGEVGIGPASSRESGLGSGASRPSGGSSGTSEVSGGGSGTSKVSGGGSDTSKVSGGGSGTARVPDVGSRRRNPRRKDIP